MIANTRLRMVLAVVMAIGALAVPATASAYWEFYDVGSTDAYDVFEPSVVCMFENNPGTSDDELDRIKAKMVMNVHHPSASLRKVGVRVVWYRNTPPHGDDTYAPYRRAPWVYKMADNNMNPKNFGPWYFDVPENTPDLWRVQLRIKYYDADGMTLIGQSRGWMEVYRHKAPDSSLDYLVGSDNGDGSDMGYCRTEFH